MTKLKTRQSKIIAMKGCLFVLENGDTVTPNLNKQSKIGDVCLYAEIRSLKTVRYQAGGTQWKEAKETGNKFFKEF